MPLFSHILFGLCLGLSKKNLESVSNSKAFLSLREATHAYLLKTSTLQNKNEILKYSLIKNLYLLINSISAKCAPRMFSQIKFSNNCQALSHNKLIEAVLLVST